MVEKQFSREELEIMKWDWIHCQNVQQVAELHACGKKDVIDALNLNEKPRPARKRRWEELHPAKARQFVQQVESGVPMKRASREAGMRTVRTGYVVYRRMTQDAAAARLHTEPTKLYAGAALDKRELPRGCAQRPE